MSAVEKLIDGIVLELATMADKILTPCLMVIIFTALWDCIKQGFYGFFEYSIGPIGIIVIVFCSLFLYISAKAKRHVED